jgi:hypothetical protein
MKKGWIAGIALTILLLLLVALAPLILPHCAVPGLERDLRESPTVLPYSGAPGLHVVMQTPHLPEGARLLEYMNALTHTLEHPQVARVHILCECVEQQHVLYEALPTALHDKMVTSNIGHRLTYADALRYANKHLRNTTTLLCNADVSVHGSAWARLNVHALEDRMFALTRHEQPGCSAECGCEYKWNNCVDTLVFVPPLAGGDELLERISFRMGGLWGCEHRFLWEVQQSNALLRISNPCRTFHTLHWHCVEGGRYRPTQDERRVSDGGRTIKPEPAWWRADQ